MPAQASGRASESVHYSEDEISTALSIYRPEHVTVFEWLGSPGRVDVGIHQRSYPFTVPGVIDYLTAGMAAVYVAQCGYLLMEHLLRSRDEILGRRISLPAYRLARDRGDVVTTEIEARFRRRIRSKDDLAVVAQAGSTRAIGAGIVQTMSFDMNLGAIRGKATCVIMQSDPVVQKLR